MKKYLNVHVCVFLWTYIYSQYTHKQTFILDAKNKLDSTTNCINCEFIAQFFEILATSQMSLGGYIYLDLILQTYLLYSWGTFWISDPHPPTHFCYANLKSSSYTHTGEETYIDIF